MSVRSIEIRTIGPRGDERDRRFYMSHKHEKLFTVQPSANGWDVRGVDLRFSTYCPAFTDDTEEVAIVYEIWEQPFKLEWPGSVL